MRTWPPPPPPLPPCSSTRLRTMRPDRHHPLSSFSSPPCTPPPCLSFFSLLPFWPSSLTPHHHTCPAPHAVRRPQGMLSSLCSSLLGSRFPHLLSGLGFSLCPLGAAESRETAGVGARLEARF